MNNLAAHRRYPSGHSQGVLPPIPASEGRYAPYPQSSPSPSPRRSKTRDAQLMTTTPLYREYRSQPHRHGQVGSRYPSRDVRPYPHPHPPVQYRPHPQIQIQRERQSHPDHLLHEATSPAPELQGGSVGRAKTAKAYETLRPAGRYQPSRGAQRDLRYTQKLAAQLGAGIEAAESVQAPQSRVQQRGSKRSDSGAGYRFHPAEYVPHRPVGHGGQNRAQAQVQAQAAAQRPVPSSRPEYDLEAMERMRSEQIATVEAARSVRQAKEKARMAAEAEGQRRRGEEEKKVRRIQLQVFVHARPTHCEWDDCQAVLNSWALLEKHVDHAHLRPRVHTPMIASHAGHAEKEEGDRCMCRCLWQGCSEVFASTQECHGHVLVRHMGAFAARCPFNCLFEGPSFPSLMAHIARRHPNATPDDFVPGLIHQRPFLPPASELPPLPPLPSSNSGPGTPVMHWLRPIVPFQGGIGGRNRKMILRNCRKGRYPRVEAYEDKKGAGAAIKAIIENAKRLRELDLPPNSAIEVYFRAEDTDMDGEGSIVELEEEEQPGTARTVVELVDVQKSAKSASDEAARELNKGRPNLNVSIPSSGSESSTDTSGSNPASSDSSPVIKGKRKGAKSRRIASPSSVSSSNSGGGSASASVTSSSSRTSRSSEYKTRADSSTGSGSAAGSASTTQGPIMTRRKLRLRIGGGENTPRLSKEGL